MNFGIRSPRFSLPLSHLSEAEPAKLAGRAARSGGIGDPQPQVSLPFFCGELGVKQAIVKSADSAGSPQLKSESRCQKRGVPVPVDTLISFCRFPREIHQLRLGGMIDSKCFLFDMSLSWQTCCLQREGPSEDVRGESKVKSILGRFLQNASRHATLSHRQFLRMQKIWIQSYKGVLLVCFLARRVQTPLLACLKGKLTGKPII